MYLNLQRIPILTLPRSLRTKIALVLKATRQHAQNLATFALLYKLFMLLLRRSSRPGSPVGKEASYDAFVAGLVGGYVVFGRGIQSSVNQQIVIYIFARVVLALAKLAIQKGGPFPRRTSQVISRNTWPVFAATSWGAVMWLFNRHPDLLQPSLRSSMVYMQVPQLQRRIRLTTYRYRNADHWDSIRNFVVHNK